MRVIGIFLSVSFLLLFSRCASLSEEECARGDWYGIGIKDGERGQLSTRFSKHQKSCSEYGVTVNRADYERGRAVGLKVFCTPSNGLRLGKRGYRYRSVCPADLEPAFLAKYRVGKQIHQVNRQVSSIGSQIITLEDQMDAEKDANKRKSIRRQIRRLRDKRRRLERQLTVLEIKN